jgi:hypothetical protein
MFKNNSYVLDNGQVALLRMVIEARIKQNEEDECKQGIDGTEQSHWIEEESHCLRNILLTLSERR